MLVLRLLVMVLTIICLMDGHAEVSSSTTGIRDRRESPAVKTNDSEVEVLDRKKKKKPKPSKKKKPKPGKKKPKPNKAKPKPAKPVTTTTTISTSTLKTTTILTTPTITTTATTTTTTVSPTTTVTTTKTTTSTASATTTLSTTTSATTSATATTVASSSTASTTTTTIPTTATTSSPPTTAATTADSGAGGECKATNGKPCIFPFKDGNEEYNECKNEGGKYFWCATSVYDSGKYKHWSYCSTDGPCPLEGDDEKCKATNNKPCVFPFKDGNKEYNECADHGGKYFWCATGTNSAGKYTAWSECPKDGSCPLPQKSTTPAMTSTATSAASTTPLTTGTTAATDQMEEKVLDTLENLVLGESRDDSLQMAHMLDKKLDTIIKDLEGETSKTELSNSDDIPPQSGKLNLTIKSGQDDMVRDGTELGEGLMFVLSTVDSMKSVSRLSGDCCRDCKSRYPGTELAEYWDSLDTCYCYKKIKIDGTEVEPKTRPSSEFTTKVCDTCCETLTISSTGGTAEQQGARLGTYKKDGDHNNKPVYKLQQGSKILFFSELAGFEWVVGSSVNSGGGLRSKPGEVPACPSDAKQWEYYLPGTTNTWIVDSTVTVDCEGGNNEESPCGHSNTKSTRKQGECSTHKCCENPALPYCDKGLGAGGGHCRTAPYYGCAMYMENKHDDYKCSNRFGTKFGVCHRVLGECVECDKEDNTKPTNCIAPRPYCSENNKCIECKLQMHCKGKDPLTTCDFTTNTCVECANNMDCEDTNYINGLPWNPQLGIAQPPNNKNVCDLTTKTCVECLSSLTDCQKNDVNKFCDVTTNRCVQCLKDRDCTNNHYGCTSTNICGPKIQCIGFVYMGKDMYNQPINQYCTYPQAFAPEVKILNEHKEEKISFHLDNDDNLTPLTVNCAYGPGNTRRLIRMSNDDPNKQRLLSLLAECWKQVGKDEFLWIISKTCRSFFKLPTTPPPPIFPVRPTTSTSVFPTASLLPQCWSNQGVPSYPGPDDNNNIP